MIIDGTLIPIDRLAADRPGYSGRHRRHEMNLQIIASPDGDIVWVSGPLPGAVHDLTAARTWGIVRELALPGWWCSQTRVTTALVTISALRTKAGTSPVAEGGQPRPRATTRTRRARQRPAQRWRILRKLRCCPWKAGQLAKAIPVLQTREIGG